MSEFTIIGGHPLEGTLAVHGAKNSVLPILAATVLFPGISVIHNCPALSDVDVSIAILEYLGCRVERQGSTVAVDASTLLRSEIPDELMRKMRSSVLFLGALLGRTGQVRLTYPGGCELGPRPIDLHLSALRRLGAEITDGADGLLCTARELSGGEIILSLPSVGATENAMLAAVNARGTTTVINAAREPEIADLQHFLQAMGVRISGAGTSVITVEGRAPLHPCEHTVIGDRIEACTYLSAAAAAGGDVELTGVDYRHLSPVTALFSEAGCQIQSGPDSVRIRRSHPLTAVRPIRTAPYPGFPTDAQPPVMAALCAARGTTVFVETVFSGRFGHVDELNRMGAQIRTEGQIAIVNGTDRLHGCHTVAHDLRGGAALLVAALGCEGISTVSGLHHIDRGYCDPEGALRSLGARIIRT